jgi:hypothetical protein
MIHTVAKVIFSLTVITLTLCACFLIPKVSHHQYDFFFYGGPRCHIITCYLYPNEDVVFGILKASHFQYDSF